MKMHRIMRDMARGLAPAVAMQKEKEREREEQMSPRSFSPGDLIEIWYKGSKISLVSAVKINNYSIDVKDGQVNGKITFVGYNEIRFYLDDAQNARRQFVSRGVTLKRRVR